MTLRPSQLQTLRLIARYPDGVIASDSLEDLDGREAAITSEHDGDPWPSAVSDGLSLPCADCGQIPRFDYRVSGDFWRRWVPDKPDRLGVVCLPCLDKRCGGKGLAEAIEAICWVGTGHTVELKPSRIHFYMPRGAALDLQGEEGR